MNQRYPLYRVPWCIFFGQTAAKEKGEGGGRKGGDMFRDTHMSSQKHTLVFWLSSFCTYVKPESRLRKTVETGCRPEF